uniref:Helicase ATP-binding domain-containing protein n=1 Tax=Oryza glumipatula TaxID=40148 RepID=A0A0D9YX19_9ORYZ
MSIDLLPCRFLLSPSAAVRVPSRRAITLLSAGASPSTPSRSAGAPSVRQRRVRAAPSVPAKQAARPRPAGENGRTTTTRRRRRRKQQGEEGEERGERGCVPSMEEASIRVGTLYQNGDPLGRKELGRCVVEWLRQGMQSMASKFASAELQGDMADLDAAALAQEWGSADGRLGFVIQAQPYMSAIPMPKGLEALCLKACTHYPTLFDHFQRELRDVLQSCQNQGLISDWRSTQSWKLLKEMANSVQHREAVRRTVPRPKAVHGSIGVSLNKVKLMQRRIEQYVTHMSDLLCIERDVELEFTQEELNAAPMLDDDSEPPKPVEYLVSHGQSQQEQCDTICNLNGWEAYIWFYSELKADTSCLQPHCLLGTCITLALESRHGDPTFSRLFGKSVRIDRIQGLADALTYERNLEALIILQRNGLQKSNASIGVVATLFGDNKDVMKMEQNHLIDWGESSAPDPRISERYALDASQLKALSLGLNKKRPVLIIQGPPGTGKTVLLTELIVRAVQQGENVLVTAPSNAAVDNMVERLSNTGLNIVRVGNPARISPSVASKSLAEIGKRCILAGDHCQLAPVILSRKALDGGLGKSLLERASSLHNGLLTTRLTVQHRMNDSIASWASKEMYHGLLKSSHSVASQTLADSPVVKATWITRCPLLLLDTRMPYGALDTGCGEQIDLSGTGSFYNDGEADIVTQHVLNLIKIMIAGVSPTAIAVQSPYIAQVQLLRERLEEYPGLSGVEVSTIDSFQGREADAVVISMVRSNPLGAVGFLGDSRRMNVAITRACRHVTVVCDTSTICHSTFLARLLRHIRRYGQVKHVVPGSLDGVSGLGFSQPTLPSIS